jgi:hypothetical protein
MPFGTPLKHHAMLRDHLRVMAYRTALFAHAKDRVVVDLGTGSGILSIFAAQAGARHVYAIERTQIASLASLMFKANGCGDRVTLLRGDSREIELPERADVLVHEVIGSDPFDENMLPILEDARQRLLAPGGRLIPARIEICCVGLELEKVPSPTERLFREAQELSGLYGVNFDPYLMALEAYRDAVALNTGRVMAPSLADRVLTRECLLRDIHFDREFAIDERTSELPISSDGMLDAVLVYFRAHLDDHIQLTNSPFTPLTSWGWSVRDLRERRPVKSGQQLVVRSRIEPIDGYQQILVEVD